MSTLSSLRVEVLPSISGVFEREVDDGGLKEVVMHGLFEKAGVCSWHSLNLQCVSFDT